MYKNDKQKLEWGYHFARTALENDSTPLRYSYGVSCIAVFDPYGTTVFRNANDYQHTGRPLSIYLFESHHSPKHNLVAVYTRLIIPVVSYH